MENVGYAQGCPWVGLGRACAQFATDPMILGFQLKDPSPTAKKTWVKLDQTQLDDG